MSAGRCAPDIEALGAGAVHDLLNVIHKLGDKPKSVILFGHNPELTEFAHRLSSEITHMPTCAVAEFTFNAKSWSHLGKAKLAKVVLDYPKKSELLWHNPLATEWYQPAVGSRVILGGRDRLHG